MPTTNVGEDLTSSNIYIYDDSTDYCASLWRQVFRHIQGCTRVFVRSPGRRPNNPCVEFRTCRRGSARSLVPHDDTTADGRCFVPVIGILFIKVKILFINTRAWSGGGGVLMEKNEQN